MLLTRRVVQAGFLGLVLWGAFVAGGNCERWCPFGGVEAIYTYATEGDVLCSLGTSNFFILGGVLLMTLLVRRAFCAYVCPIGTLSEWLHRVGRRLRLPELRVTGTADRLLALAKYGLLAIILWLTWQAGELIFRGFDPCYALISRHGADITYWAYVVSAAIVVLSLLVMLPFCRWFCPLAAVLNPPSRFGLMRVRRHAEACRDCGVCTKSCPVAIPVDQVDQVRAARCLSCLNCVAACPRTQPRALSWGPPSRSGRAWSQAALILIVLACASTAVVASYLFPLPSFVKSRGTKPAQTMEVQFRVEGLTCRGRANMLVYYLDRDDLYRIPGYLRVEAWPSPSIADVHVTYDPQATDVAAIQRAMTEPYYDAAADRWRMSPFQIEGFDPLDQPPLAEDNEQQGGQGKDY
jgi:ferredoxin